MWQWWQEQNKSWPVEGVRVAVISQWQAAIQTECHGICPTVSRVDSDKLTEHKNGKQKSPVHSNQHSGWGQIKFYWGPSKSWLFLCLSVDWFRLNLSCPPSWNWPESGRHYFVYCCSNLIVTLREWGWRKRITITRTFRSTSRGVKS